MNEDVFHDPVISVLSDLPHPLVNDIAGNDNESSFVPSAWFWLVLDHDSNHLHSLQHTSISDPRFSLNRAYLAKAHCVCQNTTVWSVIP